MSEVEILNGRAHLEALKEPLSALEEQVERIERWGRETARLLSSGGRLLAIGNGGSAAQAQHLTAELVGRYRAERAPLSAIALHAETSTVTSIGNDYGLDEIFARQVRAHGRAGDLLVALSTSGESANVLAGVRAAQERDLVTWGLTGPAPNPLAELCDDAVAVSSTQTPTIQELHLVVIHLLCAAVDLELA
jgi:D-sedoheptulose 7-phosphate isomerase